MPLGLHCVFLFTLNCEGVTSVFLLGKGTHFTSFEANLLPSLCTFTVYQKKRLIYLCCINRIPSFESNVEREGGERGGVGGGK